MKKIISIKNSVDYAFDRITCFERPIINILNQQNSYLGNCFILLSKIYSFYFCNMQEETKSQVLKLTENILNVKVENYSKKNLNFKKINKSIDNKNFFILGINLKEIFYSGYFKEDDWPHWLLINGYDDEKGIYYILDDVQYRNQSNTYSEFCLPKNLLKKARNSYIAQYGRKWSAFNLINTKNTKIQDALLNIISYYLGFDFDNGSSYTQVKLLKNFMLARDGIFSNELESSFKRKIINNDKYRTILFEILLLFMREFNYDETKINNLNDCNITAEKLWDDFVTKSILNIVMLRAEEIILPNNIIEIENDIKTIIEGFFQYLITYKEKSTCFNDTMCEFNYENNKDNIVSCFKDHVIFDFNNNNVYDWWFVDDSPKIILVSNSDFNKSYRIITNITINDNCSIQNFQAGVFIRTEKQILFCAYDIKGLLVFDEIGRYNKSVRTSKSCSLKMCIKKEKNLIVAEIYDKQDTFINKIEWYIEEADSLSIGFACKTWGNGGKIRADFDNYRIEEMK